MRPQDIEEGATYQNAGGGLARQVFGIYNHEPEPRVIFEHVNGSRKGEQGACTLRAFATWARVQVGVEQATLGTEKEAANEPPPPLAWVTLDLDGPTETDIARVCHELVVGGFAPVSYRESAKQDGQHWHVRAGSPRPLAWAEERALRERFGDDANRVRIDAERAAVGYPRGFLYDRKGPASAGAWRQYDSKDVSHASQ